MKPLALALLAFALLPLRADEQLKNPDFSDGRSHWEGDGESLSVADNAQDAPTLGEDSTVPKGGLILKLSRRDWTRVHQDFRPLSSGGTLNITYKFSDGLTFSTETNDYLNVPALMGYQGFRPFNIAPGTWVALFIETARNEMDYYTITPKTGTDTQTYQGQISDLVPRVDKSIMLAFPPGSGTITLYHVGLDSK
jgi:hypothetical protein